MTPESNRERTDYFDPKPAEDLDVAVSSPDFVSLDYIPAFQVFPVMDEEQLVYLLLTLHIGPDRRAKTRSPLNICLLIDQSSSMRGDKLYAVKTAARNLIDRLTSSDYFSLISFNDRASTVVSCQPVSSRETIKQSIDSIEGKGGTELGNGLFAAINEMRQATSITPLNYILLLTDGQTYGDTDRCVQLGEEAARHKIVIHPLGIGADWNEDLLETIAAKSGGTSEYIQSPDHIVSIFMSKIEKLRGIVTQNSSLRFEAMKGVRLNQLHRLSPVIALLPFSQTGPNVFEVNLGPITKLTDYSFLLEVITASSPGSQRLGSLSVAFTRAGVIGASRQVEMALGLTFDNLTAAVPVNPEVKSAIEKVTAFRLQHRAWQEISEGQVEVGTRRLAAASTRLLSLGEHDLARQVQREIININTSGSASNEGVKQIKFGTRNLSTVQG